tara:strand:- start:527 stop:796 length:270 start_codon:yes stop_codon:yes gene_type:complete
MTKIVMTQINLTKNPDTKTTYLVDKEVTEEITPTQYRNITSNDTLKWFRRLGGSETAQRSHTCRGYNITTLTSTSPDKQSKTIRHFKFN